MKVSKIVPIYKKGDKSNLDNYRPISITSCISKIFEYSFIYRLTEFLDCYSIINQEQHGFRSGHSTTTAMFSIYRDVVTSLEAGEYPVAVFLDLSKAFDCVSHELLFDKLENYGLRGIVLSWIKSFVGDRKQFVIIKHINESNVVTDNASSLRTVNVGVPQGSILGPLLFTLFVNDIVLVSNSSRITMYADDIALLISDKRSHEIENKCNETVSDIYDWCFSNSLFTNVPKTNYIRFHPYQYNPSSGICISIHLNNCCITHVTSFKFLGIFMDQHLNWKTHCQYVIAKLNSICYLIRSLKPLLNQSQLIGLYHAYVASRLRYGIVFWGSSSLASEVFLAQKRIIRCVGGLRPLESCRGFFVRANVMTFFGILIFELSLFVHQNKQLLTVNMDYHEYNTRGRSDFAIPALRLTTSQKSPENLGIKIYNKLPFSLKSLNLSVFKRQLRCLLVEKCYYSMEEFFSGSLV